MKEIRRKKITAIGTMLESALIQNPFRGLNRELPLPRIFINNKIYGHNTDEELNQKQKDLGKNMFENDDQLILDAEHIEF